MNPEPIPVENLTPEGRVLVEQPKQLTKYDLEAIASARQKRIWRAAKKQVAAWMNDPIRREEIKKLNRASKQWAAAIKKEGA